jgi:Leucine-rich repeat (LRR) protein
MKSISLNLANYVPYHLTTYNIHHIIFICLLMIVGWGQNCDVGEVDLGWGDCNEYHSTHSNGCMESGCYNIEETTELDLWGYALTGQIPSQIGNLTNLTYIFLADNFLTGEIPSEIGNLINLEKLSLSDNHLTGEIPSEIYNLTNLITLSLAYNELTGEIQPEIGNLVNLTILFLHSNQLTGEIPPEIGNLTNLTDLYLLYNQLTGEVPPEIENLINLENLLLYGNQLTGEIPSEIYNLTNLISLSLYDNQLTGEIPLEIGNLVSLEELNLFSNQLTGSIPPEIGNLTRLTKLQLSNNQLSSIDDNICNLTNLNWSLEYSLTNSHIYNNHLCPPYPECIQDYVGEQNTSNCPPLSISELSLPNEYSLNQPFPNPFNPSTSISFSIPEQSQTSLKVYDIKGNLISTFLNQIMNVGYHHIQWNGENLSSGTYFIRINSGKFSDVKKVVLVK